MNLNDLLNLKVGDRIVFKTLLGRKTSCLTITQVIHEKLEFENYVMFWASIISPGDFGFSPQLFQINLDDSNVLEFLTRFSYIDKPKLYHQITIFDLQLKGEL